MGFTQSAIKGAESDQSKDTVVGMTKMGNSVPRAGIEPPISGIPSQCATITPCRLPDVTTMPTPTPTCSLTSEVSADYYTRPAGIISLLMLTIIYKYAGNGLTYTYTG